jgi:hypothetical protein
LILQDVTLVVYHNSNRKWYYTKLQQKEPVAKPLVLQLAGGAKLRPTEADFGTTPYESTNCRKIAEDGERSGADLRRGFAIASKDCNLV